MITVHSYCSYKLSTSGFQYGTFKITENDDEIYYLCDKNKDSVVSSAFDYSIVKRIKGKIPSKNSFVFLFKKVSYTYGSEHDDVGEDVSLNMAFEFDDFKQFMLFSNGFENYEKNNYAELARLLADCVVPDIKIKQYKLSIHKKNMDDLIKLMVDSQQGKEPDGRRLQDRLEIVTDSYEKNLYLDDLKEIFGFKTTSINGYECGLVYLESATYAFPQKKNKKGFQINLFPKEMSRQQLKNSVMTYTALLLALITIVTILMIVIQNHRNS